MFGIYLRRELIGRRKQTVIIAIGMALAIALVIIVTSVAAGVRTAQASVLQSVYGVGTDLTVSQKPAAPTAGGARQRFDFGAGEGAAADGTTSLNRSRLMPARGSATFDASALEKITGVDQVAGASAALSLTNTTFSGEIPDFSQGRPDPGASGATGTTGSSFDVQSFTVLGLDPAGEAVGPLSAIELSDGRTFSKDDIGASHAVLDIAYADEAGLSVGDKLDVSGTEFTIIGLVGSSNADATTASNVYIPLDVAQKLSGETGKVSSIYVQASSSSDIPQVQNAIEEALPDATVSTQEDLASSISGSLSSASTLVTNLGTWLSIIVLAAAFLIAVLFTISGVTRRTREFGTLKAIGWSNRRIVGQVAGESVVQSLIGGAIGIAVGLLGILLVNLFAPTLSASAASQTSGPGGFGARPDSMPSGAADGVSGMTPPGGLSGVSPGTATSTSDVVLQAPVTVWIMVIAVGLAVLGGVLAGAIGGWRASRLRPAEALRSVG